MSVTFTEHHLYWLGWIALLQNQMLSRNCNFSACQLKKINVCLFDVSIKVHMQVLRVSFFHVLNYERPFFNSWPSLYATCSYSVRNGWQWGHPASCLWQWHWNGQGQCFSSKLLQVSSPAFPIYHQSCLSCRLVLLVTMHQGLFSLALLAVLVTLVSW